MHGLIDLVVSGKAEGFGVALCIDEDDGILLGEIDGTKDGSVLEYVSVGTRLVISDFWCIGWHVGGHICRSLRWNPIQSQYCNVGHGGEPQFHWHCYPRSTIIII